MRVAIKVINLADSKDRLAVIGPKLDASGHDWSVVEAVDGRRGPPPGSDAYDERLSRIRHDRPLSGGEIGCFLSHDKALRAFLDGPADVLILLEDDADVPPGLIDRLIRVAEELGRYTRGNWDSLHFSLPVRGRQYPAFEVDGIRINHSFYMPCGTPGLMWSRQGAKAWLDSRFGKVIMGPVDRQMRAHFARRGLSFVPETPMCVPVGFRSEIDRFRQRVAVADRGRKSSIRSKIRRHFPDHLHAGLNLVKRRLFGVSLGPKGTTS